MNPSYFRIKLSMKDALPRLALSLGIKEIGPLLETDSGKAVSLASTPQGTWRGAALFIYERKGWTVFEDVSGHFSGWSAEAWLKFAQNDEFVLAGYNDAIGFGEFSAILGGHIIRDCLFNPDEPAETINAGNLPFETERSRIRDWIGVARFVDSDEYTSSERGWLWVRDQT